MEKSDELDLIPRELAEGKLSVDEAAMKVLEEIYTNPGRFRLLDMTEDGRSDFLLDILPKLRRVVERYDESLGPLGAYVYYSLPGMRLTWQKRKLDSATGRKAVKRGMGCVYDDAADKSALFVAEPDGRESLSKPREAAPLVFKRIFGPTKYSLEPMERIRRKRSALVLALKSAWYIDDANVKKVSGYCGCSSEDMAKALEKIKGGLVEMSERRQDVAERRDRAWYFVCKYRERLLALPPNSDAWKKTRRKLEYQLSSWKRKNRLLQGCRMNVAPRNKDLAKILNLHPHRISAFLRYARKLAAAGDEGFMAGVGEEN